MIATTSTKITYQGNGLTTEFAIPFAYIEAGQIKVIITDPEDIETELETDYFVDTDKNVVIYPGYPPGQEPAQTEQPEILPEGWKLTIYRATEATQLEDIGDKYPLPVIEKMVDKNTQLIQELKEGVERSVKVDISADITPDKLLDEIYDKAAIAQSSAAAAAASENNAKASENNAKASENNAKASENNAKASEQAAAQSETNAESYKDTTYGYMTTAGKSATTATNKATEASASASAAAQSKTAAEASENIASQSATNAAGSATAAATSEANARTLVNTVNPPWNIRMASTAYAVGDIAYSASLPSWARLECVKAGTTDTGDLPITSVSAGGVLLFDGSVLWIIDDVRDCTPVGAVRGSLYLPSGYVLADGATVDRADYPRLVRLADTHNLWTNDTAANAGLFGVGDGSTTMVLPNWIDRMVQMASTAGASVAAGLPNIEGQVNTNGAFSTGSTGGVNKTGVFSDSTLGGYAHNGGASYYGDVIKSIVFDASLSNHIYGNSNTVQPPAIKLLPILRY